MIGSEADLNAKTRRRQDSESGKINRPDSHRLQGSVGAIQSATSSARGDLATKPFKLGPRPSVVQRSDRIGLRRSSPLGLSIFPDALFFLFAFFLEAGAFAGDLLFYFLNLFGFLIGERVVELLFQKNFPFREFALIDPVNLREPVFLRRGQGTSSIWIGLRETFHGEFVGAFHGRQRGRTTA